MNLQKTIRLLAIRAVGGLVTLGLFHYSDKILDRLDNNILEYKKDIEKRESLCESEENLQKDRDNLSHLEIDSQEMHKWIDYYKKTAERFENINKEQQGVISKKKKELAEKNELITSINTDGKVATEEQKKFIEELQTQLNGKNPFSTQEQVDAVLIQIGKVKEKNEEIRKLLEKIEKKSILPDLSEFNKYLDSYYAFLDSLTIWEEALFLILIINIIILLLLLNIISVFFGNELIKYFNMETRFPKLAKLLRLRTIYQRYYLIWNMFLIILCIIIITFLCISGFYMSLIMNIR